MAEEDLSRQNELVDALLKKLEQVKTLWEELPTIDDIQEIGQAAGGLASDLKGAREEYMHDDFPSEESLNEIGQAAGGLASDLKGARELSED